MDLPWKALAGVSPGQEYVALLGYLLLRWYSEIPLLFRFT
jgi:hypothetical protein